MMVPGDSGDGKGPTSFLTQCSATFHLISLRWKRHFPKSQTTPTPSPKTFRNPRPSLVFEPEQAVSPGCRRCHWAEVGQGREFLAAHPAHPPSSWPHSWTPFLVDVCSFQA